jgi:excinuclease ABC subunit C
MQDFLEKLQKLAIKPDVYRQIPQTPGVYVFFKSNIPIYIGKAINLKRRVSSYFDLDLETKTARMVAEATHLSFVQVSSELEALLLEARLIRKYMPHYNIASKDDKHPLYIRITKEKYPRIITARKIEEKEKNIAFYGPFPSSTSVRLVLKMLRKIFPYSDHKLGKRRCLYSHIGLCNPCPNEIDKSNNQKILRTIYLKNIIRLKSVLSGKFDGVKNELEKEMQTLAKEQKFEEASLARDQIERLEYITREQLPTDYYLENPNLYEDIRKNELDHLRKMLIEAGLKDIRKLNRVECFDVAHLSGTNATASMVVFVNGEPEKKDYRHFKIRKAKGGNDYDSMKEVALRREKHFDDWGRPDLIIVDGGLGQVSSFIVSVPVIGIAKNPDRLIVGNQKVKLSGTTLNFVSRIRDEAHRFARRYHHHLISKVYRGKS